MQGKEANNVEEHEQTEKLQSKEKVCIVHVENIEE
jgi:hypothetical protein